MDRDSYQRSKNNWKNTLQVFSVLFTIDCRLYFINRRFADLAELRDSTRLNDKIRKIMIKVSMKSNDTIYNHTNLQDKNAFNYAFPLRHTCLQRSPRISLFGIMVGTLQRVGSKSCNFFKGSFPTDWNNFLVRWLR